MSDLNRLGTPLATPATPRLGVPVTGTDTAPTIMPVETARSLAPLEGDDLAVRTRTLDGGQDYDPTAFRFNQVSDVPLWSNVLDPLVPPDGFSYFREGAGAAARLLSGLDGLLTRPEQLDGQYVSLHKLLAGMLSKLEESTLVPPYLKDAEAACKIYPAELSALAAGTYGARGSASYTNKKHALERMAREEKVRNPHFPQPLMPSIAPAALATLLQRIEDLKLRLSNTGRDGKGAVYALDKDAKDEAKLKDRFGELVKPVGMEELEGIARELQQGLGLIQAAQAPQLVPGRAIPQDYLRTFAPEPAEDRERLYREGATQAGRTLGSLDDLFTRTEQLEGGYVGLHQVIQGLKEKLDEASMPPLAIKDAQAAGDRYLAETAKLNAGGYGAPTSDTYRAKATELEALRVREKARNEKFPAHLMPAMAPEQLAKVIEQVEVLKLRLSNTARNAKGEVYAVDKDAKPANKLKDKDGNPVQPLKLEEFQGAVDRLRDLMGLQEVAKPPTVSPVGVIPADYFTQFAKPPAEDPERLFREGAGMAGRTLGSLDDVLTRSEQLDGQYAGLHQLIQGIKAKLDESALVPLAIKDAQAAGDYFVAERAKLEAGQYGAPDSVSFAAKDRELALLQQREKARNPLFPGHLLPGMSPHQLTLVLAEVDAIKLRLSNTTRNAKGEVQAVDKDAKAENKIKDKDGNQVQPLQLHELPGAVDRLRALMGMEEVATPPAISAQGEIPAEYFTDFARLPAEDPETLFREGASHALRGLSGLDELFTRTEQLTGDQVALHHLIQGLKDKLDEASLVPLVVKEVQAAGDAYLAEQAKLRAGGYGAPGSDTYLAKAAALEATRIKETRRNPRFPAHLLPVMAPVEVTKLIEAVADLKLRLANTTRDAKGNVLAVDRNAKPENKIKDKDGNPVQPVQLGEIGGLVERLRQLTGLQQVDTAPAISAAGAIPADYFTRFAPSPAEEPERLFREAATSAGRALGGLNDLLLRPEQLTGDYAALHHLLQGMREKLDEASLVPLAIKDSQAAGDYYRAEQAKLAAGTYGAPRSTTYVKKSKELADLYASERKRNTVFPEHLLPTMPNAQLAKVLELAEKIRLRLSNTTRDAQGNVVAADRDAKKDENKIKDKDGNPVLPVELREIEGFANELRELMGLTQERKAPEIGRDGVIPDRYMTTFGPSKAEDPLALYQEGAQATIHMAEELQGFLRRAEQLDKRSPDYELLQRLIEKLTKQTLVSPEMMSAEQAVTYYLAEQNKLDQGGYPDEQVARKKQAELAALATNERRHNPDFPAHVRQSMTPADLVKVLATVQDMKQRLGNTRRVRDDQVEVVDKKLKDKAGLDVKPIELAEVAGLTRDLLARMKLSA